MKRLKIISFVVFLMIAAVIIIGRSIKATYEKTSIDENDKSLNSEHDSILLHVNILDVNNIIDKNARFKNTAKYFSNRAYEGAPPTVPHEVEGTQIGGKACLKCHETGGYVDKFKANAPIVPHPNFENCIQCHVPVNTKNEFKDSNWELVTNKSSSEITNQALLTSPPVIPHTITKTDDCLSCHSGLGIKKVRVTHPERTNCRQCHVPKYTQKDEQDEFIRKPLVNN
ncbi:MAG: nitrate reductase cytochrome c-type subunit [Bacteroidetes bacterium]|nr:nitrate reductase cytochrome c-type subunit [Bacteroidota bacterium]